MSNGAVLSQTFPARISAVEALISSSGAKASTVEQLREAASHLDRAGPLYGRASTAVVYAAFADLLRIVAMLVEWRVAVLDADKETERFLRAAKERYRLWQSEYAQAPFIDGLLEASASVSNASSIEDVDAVCRSLASTPLPIGVFAGEPETPSAREKDDGKEKAEPPELAIAFLQFLIDEHPADETHFLTPKVVHDLEIEVRVSRWPESANGLTLMPVTIEPKSTYDFPVFEFARPAGDPPFRLKQRGRAVLNSAQGLQARPFEFKYAASFTPASAEQPLAVVGQRTLLIEAFDLTQSALTGYRAIDEQLLHVRNQLRAQRLITPAELDSVLQILKPLCSLAGRAVQDALFKSTCNEAYFQTEIRNELRRVPMIASELEEHPQAAGGITDLSFHGIRIELKVETQTLLTLDACEKFADQTVSYVVGTGKRVGILCVLDNSPKGTSAFPAEQGIGILSRPAQTHAVHIITVLVQGNLARPSDLSR
jgi:hypothetical protein